MTYNPFSKSIGDNLLPEDLQVLLDNSVREGYYMEYKREFPNKQEKIAKSIASFANSYGGWYIVGVAANIKLLVTDICGFKTQDYPDPLATLRNIVKTDIDPTPMFYPQLVTIGEDKVVLVVYIPDEQETPFITKDGVIYRRVNDSSEPVPENRRDMVDRLVDSGKKSNDRFLKFCRDDRTLSKRDGKMAWLKVYVSPYPRTSIEKKDLFTTESLNELLEHSRENINIHFGLVDAWYDAKVNFNSVQLTNQGILLRETKPPDVTSTLTSCELFDDGSAKLYIPLYQQPPTISYYNSNT